MNDLKALEDAFAELERRADNAPVRAEARKSRVPRLVPVAAAVLVAGGLVTGVAVLSSGSPSPVQEGAPTTTLPVQRPAVPATAKDLEARFRMVLGGSASFTVTHTGGAAIVGVLTASGRTGGFDLQIIKASPGGAGAHCEDLDRADCKIRKLADGSSLAVSTEPLEGPPGGITHMVDLVRTDGVELLMHVSNQRDPKGDSEILSPKPPLDTDQMIKMVTSTEW